MEIRINRASPLDRLYRAVRIEAHIHSSRRAELTGESQAPRSLTDSIVLALKVNSMSITQSFMEISGQGTNSEKAEARQLITALKLFHKTGELPLSLQSDITLAGQAHQAIINFMGIKPAEPEW